ncbi:MAG: glycosyltransferase family 2 protein [Armatimonadota bacterium]|nr:glycosyltransferase family 2 protein [Armatimonadota bacterium]MCX7776825.1 glycosyltransferase family 2 protein [Armatimonadota bacterium]MDW8024620.1 glycosyltransferase family 2 protein [Armatimonadota bacterium]
MKGYFNEPLLSIVIPAYNEERRLPQTISCIVEYVRRKQLSCEIVVVDDGSSDATSDVAISVAGSLSFTPLRVLRYQPNMGKGYAVNRGVLSSSGRFVLFTDADLSTPIEETEKLLQPLLNGYCDIAIASRALAGSELPVRQPLFRELMGRAFNVVVQALLLPGIRDTQCGFKCFTRQAAQDVFIRQRTFDFAFDVEILYIARKLGYRIVELPVRWMHSPETKVKVFKHGFQMLLSVFQIRWRGWWGVYGMPLRLIKPLATVSTSKLQHELDENHTQDEFL